MHLDTRVRCPFVSFSQISTRRITDAFRNAGIDWTPVNVLDRLPELVRAANGKHDFTKGAVA